MILDLEEWGVYQRRKAQGAWHKVKKGIFNTLRLAPYATLIRSPSTLIKAVRISDEIWTLCEPIYPFQKG